MLYLLVYKMRLFPQSAWDGGSPSILDLHMKQNGEKTVAVTLTLALNSFPHPANQEP